MNRRQSSLQKVVVHNKIEDLYSELVGNAVFFPSVSKKEKEKAQPEMFHSNLPNISDIINTRKKLMPENLKLQLIELTEYTRSLENMLRLKKKEIERLQFYNNFLTIASQKKEELLEQERKELNRLKDELSKLHSLGIDKSKGSFGLSSQSTSYQESDTRQVPRSTKVPSPQRLTQFNNNTERQNRSLHIQNDPQTYRKHPSSSFHRNTGSSNNHNTIKNKSQQQSPIRLNFQQISAANNQSVSSSMMQYNNQVNSSSYSQLDCQQLDSLDNADNNNPNRKNMQQQQSLMEINQAILSLQGNNNMNNNDKNGNQGSNNNQNQIYVSGSLTSRKASLQDNELIRKFSQNNLTQQQQQQQQQLIFAFGPSGEPLNVPINNNNNNNASSMSNLGNNTLQNTSSPGKKEKIPITGSSSSSLSQKNNTKNNNNNNNNNNAVDDISASNLIPMNNFLAGGNQTDTLKTPTIINLALTDEDALGVYNSNENINFLHNLVKDESKFQEFIHKASHVALAVLYEKIRKTLQDSKVFFLLLIRLKKIIRAAFKMTTALALSDALETIINETSICNDNNNNNKKRSKKNLIHQSINTIDSFNTQLLISLHNYLGLECDRCTVFVFDEQKNELWSKIAKGIRSVIRMPVTLGIAGYVARTKQTVNILNAYADQRFNKEFDKKTNYKTKTILCGPIINEQGRLLGVIQCINKLNGHFTKDDEALMMMIADFSKIVLRNSMDFDEQNFEHNKLRSLIDNSLIYSEIQDLDEIVKVSEQKLRNFMHIDDARIIVNSMDGNVWYLDEGNKRVIRKATDGIAGCVISKSETINCFNCYTHEKFSPEIDINTQMPVLSIPILHRRCKEPLGVIQVANVKGISNIYDSVQPKIFPLDKEVLAYFARQLSVTILTRLEWFGGIEFPEMTEVVKTLEEQLLMILPLKDTQEVNVEETKEKVDN